MTNHVRLVMNIKESEWIGADGDLIGQNREVFDMPFQIVRHRDCPMGIALIVLPDEDVEERIRKAQKKPFQMDPVEERSLPFKW